MRTRKILILGAGKIGRTIVELLLETGDYQVRIADASEQAIERFKDRPGVEACVVNAAKHDELLAAMKGYDCVLSALSFRFNPLIAEVALEAGLSYFDLTEDVETTRRVRKVAEKAKPDQIFMPQCGLAPGFVSIAAHQLTLDFDKLDTVWMRVGALPQFPSNIMKYNLTWSTDGLINEYCNPCEAIHDGRRLEVLPLEGHELFSLDGIRYEAFNTSGGLGTLCETLDGKVRELNYRTVRYQGHRDLMKFLIGELRMGERRENLKEILESSIPITFQDVVVVFCTVTGWKNGQLLQVSDARKIYAKTIKGEPWSAIQITTASAILAVVDMHFEGSLTQQGFVKQEEVSLDTFLANRFGKAYANKGTFHFGQEAPTV